MSDTFLTVQQASEGIYKEKGSKFLAYTYYVESEQDIREKLDSLKKKYYDATHHCYAYVLGKDRQHFRANDDGEPNGTAGLPILNQIKSKGLTNVLLVVVRYYGGTKLGAAGLVAAYKTAAAQALEEAGLVEKIVFSTLNLHFPYLSLNEVMKIIKDFDLQIADQHFDNDCLLRLRVRQSLESEVRAKLEKVQGLIFAN